MFLENHYISFKNNDFINYPSYNKIQSIKFINKYIEKYIYNYTNNKKLLYEDAITYSKYYVYYKTLNCIYSPDVMEIIFSIDK